MATSLVDAKQNVRDGEAARSPFETIWAECDNFLRSEQNLFRTPDGTLINGTTIPAVQRKLRHVYNVIQARFMREVAAYTSLFPGFQVDPSPPVNSMTGEVSYQASQAAAVAAERQLANDYDQLHLGVATGRAKWLAVEFGEGYAWCDHDSTKGKPIGNSGKYTGCNRVTVLDPSQLTWRRGRRYEESDFVDVRTLYTKKEVHERWKVPLEDIKPDAISTNTLSESLINEGFADANLVTVHEYYEKPTSGNPKGVHITFMGDKELAREDYPYDFDETNDEQWIVRYTYTQPERQSRGKGMVQDMLDTQRAFNRRMNLLSEWTGIAASPMPVYTRRVYDTQNTSLWPGKGWISEPALDNGKPVSFVEVPNLPDWVASSPEKLQSSMDTITGQYDLNNIATSAAASTIQRIVEQDQNRRGEVARGFNDSDARVGTRLLLLARKHYTEPRELNYKGQTGETTIRGFVASQELPQRINVRVTTGPPKTPDQNAQMIQNWMQTGAIPPPIGILATVDNTPEIITEPIKLNMGKQQRENLQIYTLDDKVIMPILQKQAMDAAKFVAAGGDPASVPPPLGPWPMPSDLDNHEIQMRQMENWFLTPEWEQMSPVKQMAAKIHYQAHKQMQEAKDQQAAMVQTARAETLGQNNAASTGGDKPMPSQAAIPEGAPAPAQ